MAKDKQRKYSEITYDNVDISDFVPEKDKDKLPYLKANVDYTINMLDGRRRAEAERYAKARRLYHKERTQDDLLEIKDYFGIDESEDFEFNSLVDRHLNAIVGLFESNEIQWTTTSKDPATIRRTTEARNQAFQQELHAIMMADLRKAIVNQAAIDTNEEYPMPVPTLNERRLDEIRKKYNMTWRSQEEVNVSLILTSFFQDISHNLNHKFSEIFKDYIMVGKGAWRLEAKESGTDPQFNYVMPENVAFDAIDVDGTTNKATRGLVIEDMTPQEFLRKYGHFMDSSEVAQFTEIMGTRAYADVNHQVYGGSRDYYTTGVHPVDAPYGGALNPDFLPDVDTIRVYYVEWIATNPVKIIRPQSIQNMFGFLQKDLSRNSRKEMVTAYRQDLYCGIRVMGPRSQDMYLAMGKYKAVNRSAASPRQVRLTIGALYNNLNKTSKKPTSLMLDTQLIQDKYDLLQYQEFEMSKALQISATNLDTKGIPDYIAPKDESGGVNPVSKILAWYEYRRRGMNLYDSEQLGPGGIPGQTKTADDASTLITVSKMIADIEDRRIFHQTGLTPQLLGAIEQRETNANVKLSINQVGILLKNQFSRFYNMMSNVLTQMVELTKYTYQDSVKALNIMTPEGVVAHLINGQDMMNIDHDIHINYTGEETKILSDIKMMAAQSTQSGQMDPVTSTKIMSSRSVTEAIHHIDYHQRKKEEKEMTQQEFTSQLEDLNNQLNEANKRLQQFEQRNLDLEERKVRMDEIKIKNDRDLKEKELDLKARDTRATEELKEAQTEKYKSEIND